MTPSLFSEEARQALNRRGRLRWAIGMNVVVSILLAVAFVVLLNALSAQYYLRTDWSAEQRYTLSEPTLRLLSKLTNDVEVVLFFQRGHEGLLDTENLLREYQYRSPKIRLEYVDPDRHLNRAADRVAAYQIPEPNVVVFHSEGKTQIVKAADLIEYDYTGTRPGESVARKVLVAEQAFSSALYNVTQSRRPVVYFLLGHGERRIDNYDPMIGYSSIAKRARRDHIDVRTLRLGEATRIPDDADALVIAGPTRRMPQPELDLLGAYLEQSGRMMILVDSQTRAGLDPMLNRWGIQLGDDVVVDPARTLTGGEVYVTEYGPHPITDSIQGVASIFHSPRSVASLRPQNGSATEERDKPHVTVLSTSSASSWAEREPERRPIRFDAGIDRMGPISIAAAVERGAVPDIHVQIRATRLVVFGDSSFVSNAALTGGDEDLFMNALNWLIDRDRSLDILPHKVQDARLTLNRRQLNRLFLLVSVGLPCVVAVLGIGVWVRRRN